MLLTTPSAGWGVHSLAASLASRPVGPVHASRGQQPATRQASKPAPLRPDTLDAPSAANSLLKRPTPASPVEAPRLFDLDPSPSPPSTPTSPVCRWGGDPDKDTRGVTDEDIALALACAEFTSGDALHALIAQVALSTIPGVLVDSRDPSKEVEEAIFGACYTVPAPSRSLYALSSSSSSISTASSSSLSAVSSSDSMSSLPRELEDKMLHDWAEERVTGFCLNSTLLQGANTTIERAHPVEPTLHYSLLRHKCELEINDRCERIGRYAPCYTSPVLLDEGCTLYGRRMQENLSRPGRSPLSSDFLSSVA
ncbi:uncharacterized protein BXZ73DRAFT_100091 [Epithele typhae]|uniref:uncharacterized protein n=1 Tax=Epithele typhae TaxID=378194 RepID=UPI002007AE84|nr:uncharacterized protein BXZ73DRAFT_100091 [Epithele typhae]KAH9937876.1 hypothetical protein BXZ73DRAFT_100091 [Epithele typhae]